MRVEHTRQRERENSRVPRKTNRENQIRELEKRVCVCVRKNPRSTRTVGAKRRRDTDGRTEKACEGRENAPLKEKRREGERAGSV